MSHLSRRHFLGALGACGAAYGLSNAAFGQPTSTPAASTDFLKWEEVAKGAFVSTGNGGNSLFIYGKDGGVLVDCKNAPYGAVLRRECEARGKKILQVINTHHHADHTGGNHALSADIEIVAHEKCTDRVLGQMNRYISQLKEAVTTNSELAGEAAKRVREENIELYKNVTKLKATDFVPKVTFAKDHNVKFQDVSLKLTYFGTGHTDNDIVVFDESRNILHTGDLLFHRSFPFVDVGSGANSQGWQNSLREALKLCNAKTVVVPGHGTVTDIKGIEAQIELFDVVRDAVGKAIKAGKTRKEVSEMKLEKYATYERQNISNLVMGAVFDELSKK